MAVNRARDDEKRGELKKKEIFLRLMRYTSKYKKEVIVVIVIMMALSMLLASLPLLTRNAVDVQIANRDLKGLLIVMGIYIFLVIIWWIFYIVRVKIMARVANKVVLQIRDEVFAHLQTLGLYYFDSRPTGKILSRLIGDITSMKDMLKQLVTTVVPNSFYLLCISVAMFIMNPILALGAFVSLPVIAVGTFLIMKYTYPMWYSFRQKQSNIAGYAHEAFSGIKVVQSFTAEEETKKSFEEINSDIYKHWVKAVRIADLLSVVIDLSQGIGYFMLYFFAIYLLKIDASSVGELIAFATYISLFWQPIRSLANMYNQLSNNLAGAGRVFEILNEKSALKDDLSLPDLPQIKGDVTFDKVSFAYPDEPDVLILDKLSFSVKSGERVALVGPTGAGKTTVINLICRFYEPVSGRILIDGKDISHYSLSSLRSQVGVMTQESYLFSGTLMENIRYGRMSASDEEVKESCRITGADSFISKLPKGYESDASEANLSQGQKQLVALSRTLLSNPHILILDEATSSIDTHTELLVQQGIARLMEGRTSFVVAHRLSTIRNADVIFVIDNKGILEKGSHEELLKKNGAYAALYRAQFAT